MSAFTDPRLGDAVNQAARDLPKGWELCIQIEAGCGEVVLFRPSGVEEILPETDEPLLSDRVQAAVAAARAEEAKRRTTL